MITTHHRLEVRSWTDRPPAPLAAIIEPAQGKAACPSVLVVTLKPKEAVGDNGELAVDTRGIDWQSLSVNVGGHAYRLGDERLFVDAGEGRILVDMRSAGASPLRGLVDGKSVDVAVQLSDRAGNSAIRETARFTWA